MELHLDHLVVAARTLDEGAAWCERRLGITPGTGGRHALMGTHNLVFSIASPGYPRAYVEIIAIDPAAPPPGRARWFDLDDAVLQRELARGPMFIHWVARCADLDGALAALRSAGTDPGEAIAAERPGPHGTLRWKIAVRRDGTRLHDGVWPTLIEWGATHPADAMPASGASLESLHIGGLPRALATLLRQCGRGVVVAPPGSGTDGGGATMQATLRTPRGSITLQGMRPEAVDGRP